MQFLQETHLKIIINIESEQKVFFFNMWDYKGLFLYWNVA